MVPQTFRRTSKQIAVWHACNAPNRIWIKDSPRILCEHEHKEIKLVAPKPHSKNQLSRSGLQVADNSIHRKTVRCDAALLFTVWGVEHWLRVNGKGPQKYLRQRLHQAYLLPAKRVDRYRTSRLLHSPCGSSEGPLNLKGFFRASIAQPVQASFRFVCLTNWFGKFV